MSWFSKKESLPDLKDLIFINATAKFRAVKKLSDQHPDPLLLTWFPDTQFAFEQFCTEHGLIVPAVTVAREVNSFQAANKTIIFLEHYPLREKEMALVQSWKPAGIYVLSALDEPLFRHYGGDRITQLFQLMGMKEDEPLEHAMITNAIHKAQQKLAKKVTVEHAANSMEDWFRKNVVSK
jgi:hypothetical protein